MEVEGAASIKAEERFLEWVSRTRLSFSQDRRLQDECDTTAFVFSRKVEREKI
jgi:hypothetical protein